MSTEKTWISTTARAHAIEREGFDTLYIIGVNGKAASFYSTDDAAWWLSEQGITSADPIWLFLGELAKEAGNKL